MAADHEDRARLAKNAAFAERVTGAVLVQANAVGIEAAGPNVERAQKRMLLVGRVLTDLEGVGIQFARAAAGGTIANAFADAATAATGTQAEKDVIGVAAISDAAITTYVSSAAVWDVIAVVFPWERNA